MMARNAALVEDPGDFTAKRYFGCNDVVGLGDKAEADDERETDESDEASHGFRDSIARIPSPAATVGGVVSMPDLLARNLA